MKARRTISWALSYTEHRSILSGFLRRRLGRREDIEDLAQEVYLRLLRAEENGAAINNAEAYLYTVALNLIRERAVLRRWPGATVDIDQVSGELAAEEEAPEDRLDRIARERRLASIIETLPPKLRAVIVMQYREDMSYEQMAGRLGVTTHTIKKYVGQALALCRREFGRKKRHIK